jgi:mono/diheme cytochrome c family protein
MQVKGSFDIRRRSTTRLIWLLTVAGIAALVTLAACSSGSPDATSAPAPAAATQAPAADGQALLEDRCSSCHSADRVRSEKKSGDEWQSTVSRMVGKGAELTEAEQAVLVDYLAATYGP